MALGLVFAQTGTAAIAEKTFIIQLDGFCDGLRITVYPDMHVATGKETGCRKSRAVGTIGTFRGHGKAITLGLAYSRVALTFVAQYPLVSGGWWILYGNDGSLKIESSGTYTVLNGPSP